MEEKTRPTGKPAPEVVRDGLRAAIIAGDFGGRHSLRQDEIAEMFGTFANSPFARH